MQLVFVLEPVVMAGVVIFWGLHVCLLLLLLLHLVLILLLSIHVYTEGYGAVGVCWGKRARMADDA